MEGCKRSLNGDGSVQKLDLVAQLALKRLPRPEKHSPKIRGGVSGHCGCSDELVVLLEYAERRIEMGRRRRRWEVGGEEVESMMMRSPQACFVRGANRLTAT